MCTTVGLFTKPSLEMNDVAKRLLVITFDIVYTFWSSCPSASFFGIVPYCLVKCHTIMAIRISEIAFFFSILVTAK